MKKTLFLLVLILIIVGCSDLDTILEDNITDTETEEVATSKESVKIDRVVDGDTIDVELSNGHIATVRLLLIDTPESVHPEKEEQPFGKESSDFAKKRLKKGQTVTLEIGNPKRDKYERLLAYIWLDEVNFNQLMIEEGFARIAYIYEPNTKYLEEFKKAENQAEKNGNNIWSIDGYVESEFNDY